VPAETITFATTGSRVTDTVIATIEQREEHALHERHRATTKAIRAHADALSAADRGDLGALRSALARLDRYARAAGSHAEIAERSAGQLAAALDPPDTDTLHKAVAQAAEWAIVARAAAERTGHPAAGALKAAAGTLRRAAQTGVKT